MVTRFKLKKDAEAFVRELKERCGDNVYHKMYKGHRDYCVDHNKGDFDLLTDAKIAAEEH